MSRGDKTYFFRLDQFIAYDFVLNLVFFLKKTSCVLLSMQIQNVDRLPAAFPVTANNRMKASLNYPAIMSLHVEPDLVYDIHGVLLFLVNTKKLRD